MGIKYKPTVKDHKLGNRFQKQVDREGAPAVTPGTRTPKKLSKKAAARLAAKAGAPDPSKEC